MKTPESSWRMWLVLVLAFIFTFVFSQIAQAGDLTKEGWYRLMDMSTNQQLAFMEGYIIGTYGAAMRANWLYGFSQSDALQIMILDETPAQVMLEVLQWYARTQRWDAPIWVVMYRRFTDW